MLDPLRPRALPSDPRCIPVLDPLRPRALPSDPRCIPVLDPRRSRALTTGTGVGSSPDTGADPGTAPPLLATGSWPGRLRKRSELSPRLPSAAWLPSLQGQQGQGQGQQGQVRLRKQGQGQGRGSSAGEVEEA